MAVRAVTEAREVLSRFPGLPEAEALHALVSQLTQRTDVVDAIIAERRAAEVPAAEKEERQRAVLAEAAEAKKRHLEAAAKRAREQDAQKIARARTPGTRDAQSLQRRQDLAQLIGQTVGEGHRSP